jgi:hypothetical protein
MARAAATSKPAKIFVFIQLMELSFRANKRPLIKTVCHSILVNWVRRGSRAKFRTFKDSSEVGMKPRLAQTLSDYHPSAPSFSAIRTKSAREEGFRYKQEHAFANRFSRDWSPLEEKKSALVVTQTTSRKAPAVTGNITSNRLSVVNMP